MINPKIRFPVIYVAIILSTLVILFLGGVSLWKIPQLKVNSATSLTEKEKIELENEIRNSLSQAFGTLVQATGGVALVTGVYFTWRNLIATEEKQVTERFTKAIDQLGGEAEICIGGIYALERVASDSEKDHWVVMEVLSSFIRERASLDKNRGSKKKVSREVQAALTVIKRRDSSKDPRQKVLDLSFTYLKGAKFNGEEFRTLFTKERSFTKADLRNVNLTSSNLEEADFTGSDLSNACLAKANLEKTNFTESNLSNTDFTDALVDKAIFGGSSFNKAKGLKIT